MRVCRASARGKVLHLTRSEHDKARLCKASSQQHASTPVSIAFAREHCWRRQGVVDPASGDEQGSWRPRGGGGRLAAGAAVGAAGGGWWAADGAGSGRTDTADAANEEVAQRHYEISAEALVLREADVSKR